MAEEERFFTILTKVGKAKISNAHANRAALELKDMAVGDGAGAYYNPSEDMVALKNEKYRREMNNLSIDPDNLNYLICEMVIPSDAGGFYIREAAIFDADGDMIAIGKIPETYKPTLDTGAAKDLYMRFIIEVSNSSAVTLKINPSVVLATKEMAEKAANDAVSAHALQVNPHNQYLMKKDYTAADVLAKLITVDGTASGIDADKLDGVELETINAAINAKQPSGDYATNTALNQGLAGKQPVGSYATATHNHASVYQPVGDYATNISLNNGLAGKQPTGNYAASSHSHAGVYQPVGDYATNTSLNNGLAGKQPTGNYAAASHNHSAVQVTFTDGLTFQQKLDGGTLRGQQGAQGPQGIQGPQGYTGAQGPQGTAAGLWDPRTLDNTVITLPSGGTWAYIAMYGLAVSGLVWYRPRIGVGGAGNSLLNAAYGAYNGAVIWRVA